MRRLIGMMTSAALLATLVAAGLPGVATATATCTTVTTSKGDMGAAAVNPGSLSGATVDAGGCQIGVYYSTPGSYTVSGTSITNAQYYGIFVDGITGNVAVNVTGSTISDIGDSPFDGAQHGVAVYYDGYNTSGTVSGTVSGNTISAYQKGGIVVNGTNADVDVTGNTVTGLGPVPFIAQNGIQFGYGASGSATGNTVLGNSYTGTNDAVSTGILVVGGPGYGAAYTTGLQVVRNTLAGNDVGVYLSNLTADYGIPTVPTNIKVVNNTISNNALNNVSGNGYPDGYQAGISDYYGVNDKIINNTVSGDGYKQEYCGSAAYCAPIDVVGTALKVHANAIQ